MAHLSTQREEKQTGMINEAVLRHFTELISKIRGNLMLKD
jgi:hypothetical protein